MHSYLSICIFSLIIIYVFYQLYIFFWDKKEKKNPLIVLKIKINILALQTPMFSLS